MILRIHSVIVYASLALGLVYSQLAISATLTVGSNAECGYATIQAAVDDSRYGDEIVVYPGVYEENIIIIPVCRLTGSRSISSRLQ